MAHGNMSTMWSMSTMYPVMVIAGSVAACLASQAGFKAFLMSLAAFTAFLTSVMAFADFFHVRRGLYIILDVLGHFLTSAAAYLISTATFKASLVSAAAFAAFLASAAAFLTFLRPLRSFSVRSPAFDVFEYK